MGLKALGIRLGRGQAEGDANAGVPAFDLHFAAEGFNPAAHAHKAGAGVQLAALSVILDHEDSLGGEADQRRLRAGMANDVGDRFAQGEAERRMGGLVQIGRFSLDPQAYIRR